MGVKKFQRKIEDFVCENCKAEVKGDGYTNHCPACLWGKHMDVNPGDRMSKCGGIMKPISVYIKNGQNIILHKCQMCGLEKNNKSAKNDNFEKMIEISKKTV
jgi:hypothetical protein